MPRPRSMSVIVPVFNEEAQIPTIVPAIKRTLQDRGGDWEILVIDNASTDSTLERMQVHLQDPHVRLLRNDVNRGKGYSVRRGMLEARCELRLMCDADCAASLESLPAIEAATADAEVIAGVRNAPDSRVVRHQPLHRRVVSLGFIILCRAVMAEPLRDVFCGFKLFTADAAQEVFTRSRIEGWAFDAEALALARTLGFRVRPCGIAWVNRPDSRLSIPRVVVPVLRELVRTRIYLRRQIRPQVAAAAAGAHRSSSAAARETPGAGGSGPSESGPTSGPVASLSDGR